MTHGLFAYTMLDVEYVDVDVLFFINWTPKDDDDDSLEDVGFKFQPGIQALRTEGGGVL